MFYLENIKDWIIKHKKLVITVLAIIALLIILYQYRFSNKYLFTLYSYIWPFGYYNDDSYYISPMIPSESTGGFTSIPQLYL